MDSVTHIYEDNMFSINNNVEPKSTLKKITQFNTNKTHQGQMSWQNSWLTCHQEAILSKCRNVLHYVFYNKNSVQPYPISEELEGESFGYT